MAELNVLSYALVFLVMFFIGGTIGYFCFPQIPGIFFIAGLVFAAFATGAGKLVINR